MDFPIKNVTELEKISSSVKCQYFEKLVAFIFEQNSFGVKQNVVVKDGFGIKRQIDVIAKRYDTTYLVECKKWRSRERISGINNAVKKHTERCNFYATLNEEKIVPLIVTLIDDNIKNVDDVPVVPIMKLNAWLNEL